MPVAGGCAATKHIVSAGDMSIAEAMVLNEAPRAPLDDTHDYREGIEAFFEKRRRMSNDRRQ